MGDLTENFDNAEFSSPDGVLVPAEYAANLLELAQNLEVLRRRLGLAININSGFRSEAYNATLPNAAPGSRHLTAQAADIRVDGKAPADVYCLIEDSIRRGEMKQGGLGIYTKHVHYDTRGYEARGFGDAPVPQCAPIPDEPEEKQQEEDEMAVIITADGTKNYVTNFVHRRFIETAEEREKMVKAGLPAQIHKVSQETLNAISPQPVGPRG